MTSKFSLAHLTLLDCPPPELIDIAARAGYDFVSLRTMLLGLPGEPNYALADNRKLLRQTRRALRDTGLALHDIELVRIADGYVPKNHQSAFEIGAELGARQVLSSIWTSQRNFAVEAFAEVCDLVKPLGMTVNLEFPTWASVTTLEEAMDVLRAAKRDNVGIMIDTLHFYRSRVTLQELDAVPREYFHFAHICDAPKEIPATKEGLIHTGRDERLYVGEGAIDIAAILNRLPEMVYAIELPHLVRVKEMGAAVHATRCLETAKAYLEAHPRS